MKSIIGIVLLAFLCGSQASAEKDRGGGDLCEARIQSIRDDLRSWIIRGGHKGLNLIAITTDDYAKQMLRAISIAKMRCVKPGDKGYPVQVNGTPKECRFDSSGSRAMITCDTLKFEARSEDDQYRLIHHEFAGIARVEKPDGDISTYEASKQISEFLVETVIKRLAVKRPDSTDKKSRSEPLNHPSFSYFNAAQAFQKLGAPIIRQVVGTWLQIGATYNPELSDNNEGWYSSDGVDREARGPHKYYELRFRFKEDALGNEAQIARVTEIATSGLINYSKDLSLSETEAGLGFTFTHIGLWGDWCDTEIKKTCRLLETDKMLCALSIAHPPKNAFCDDQIFNLSSTETVGFLVLEKTGDRK